MQNCEPLAWYGAIVLLAMIGLMVIPYLRGKAELLSAWNFLLMGIAIFVGLGGIEAAQSPMRFQGLEWFQPTKVEVNRFMLATTVFLVALVASYYYDPFSKKLAAGRFNKWPPMSTGVLLTILAICFVFVALSEAPPLRRMTGVGQFLMKVSHKSFVYATVFSFVLWFRQKLNVAWLGMFLGVMAVMCVLAMIVSPGRRLLMSLFVGPVLVMYFSQARHWRPTKGVVVVGAAGIALFVVNLMYTSIRHYKAERNAQSVLEQVKTLGERNWFERFAQDRLYHFSQQAVHYALLTDYFVESGRLPPRPLNTILMMIAYPVPRAIWDDKPQVLAKNITKDVVGWEGTNWGCSVAGHAIYEGEYKLGGYLFVAALYAYLMVYLIRLIDDPLRRQPDNPFLIGMLAASATHLLGWERGDLATMTLNCIEVLFFCWAISLFARLLFGTQRLARPMRMPARPYRLSAQSPA